jgi:hypothetical protein
MVKALAAELLQMVKALASLYGQIGAAEVQIGTEGDITGRSFIRKLGTRTHLGC